MEEGPPRKQPRLEPEADEGKSSTADTLGKDDEQEKQCPFSWNLNKGTVPYIKTLLVVEA